VRALGALAAAYRCTRLIIAASSHDARFSRRCDLAGDRSPEYSATDHPFRDGRSLTSTFTFPGPQPRLRPRKLQRIAPIRADLSRSARPAPILAAAALDP
jgi:hypothetical protein